MKVHRLFIFYALSDNIFLHVLFLKKIGAISWVSCYCTEFYIENMRVFLFPLKTFFSNCGFNEEESLAYNSQPSVILKDTQFLMSKEVCAKILTIFFFPRIPSSLDPPSSLEPVQYCWPCLWPCLSQSIPT